MEILQLISGDTCGGGALGDYSFERITVSGEKEKCLMEELDEWVLVDSYTEDMMTASGDFYGSGISSTHETRLTMLAESCFIHEGRLLGYRTDRMILFTNGKTVGKTTYVSYGDDSRESGEYSLKKR